MARTKYVVTQAFKVIIPIEKGKGKKKVVQRIRQTETILPGTYYNFSDSVLNSKTFKFYQKHGKIKVYEEQEIVDREVTTTKDEKPSFKAKDPKIEIFKKETKVENKEDDNDNDEEKAKK